MGMFWNFFEEHHFTKRWDGLHNLSYTKRLKILNLPSLEFRRMRGDLIETYNILHGLYDKSITDTLFDRITNSITRTNGFKLIKHRVESKKYQWFLTNRVIDTWNKLPNYIAGLSEFRGSAEFRGCGEKRKFSRGSTMDLLINWGSADHTLCSQDHTLCSHALTASSLLICASTRVQCVY